MKDFSGKDINQYIEEKEGNRLRGAKLSQLKKDLQNTELTKEEKAIKYSQHLNWCLSVFENIYKMSTAASAAGVYDRSPMSLGIANGLISAMAVIVEEQSTVPYLKAPKKYRNGEAIIDEMVEEYLARLERLIGSIIVADEKGPKGYEGEYPMLAWVTEAVDTISRAPVATDKLVSIRSQIRDFMKELEDQNYKPKKGSNGTT